MKGSGLRFGIWGPGVAGGQTCAGAPALRKNMEHDAGDAGCSYDWGGQRSHGHARS